MKKFISFTPLLLVAILIGCNEDDSDCNCPSPASPSTPGEGDLVITEIMLNPAAVADSDGEWFEVYNASSTVTFNLNGVSIESNNNNPFTISEELLIQPNKFIVLGVNGANDENGGILVDLVYDDINLSNAEDIIYLKNGETVIDSVLYTQEFNMISGASLNLDIDFLDAAANDNPFNWCVTSNSQLASGDFATPRNFNEDCP